jgi:hypothetical protein
MPATAELTIRSPASPHWRPGATGSQPPALAGRVTFLRAISVDLEGALQAAGCERIFSEKACGVSTNGRCELKALLPGDVVVAGKLDWLARNSRDLHNIVGELAERACGFVSLGEAWCDTTTDVGRLMMTVVGGINEFEGGLIRKRCEEGIETAKATRPRVRSSAARRLWMPERGKSSPSVNCWRDDGNAGPRV